MKFSILQENLSKGLQAVSKAIPTKAALPILSNVLLVAKDGRLKIAATNLETAISTYVPASIEKEGSLTVPAKLLREFVSNISSTTINAEQIGQFLVLKSEKTKSKLNGINPEDYPQLPEIPADTKYITIKPKDLDASASIVAFAAGTDSSRPVFTGVFLKYKDQKLIIAATDGFRLSEKSLNVEGDLPEFTTIIPAKTFLEVARLFSGASEDIKLILNENENLALFSCGETMVATRVLDGQYPDYNRIIPTDHVVTANVSSEEFLEAVRLTSIFSKEGNSTIRITLSPNDRHIKIISLAQEAGEHESIIESFVEGESLDIAFNSKYLLDFLNNVKTDQIKILASGNVTPCMLQSEKHEEFLHIIMPIQI